MDWTKERVLVTGGTGFLGSHLMDHLRDLHPMELYGPGSQVDLRRWDSVTGLFRSMNPTIVFHLAATVGGIGANRENPATFFYDNLTMTMNVMEAARLYGGKKYVGVGTVCSYPKFCKVPFREEDLWEGYPEETNAPYGLAKRMQIVQARAYREQHGFNAIVLIPVNLYGPRDNFKPESSHVIPALMKRFLEAKEQGKKNVIVWGTGSASREFLHVRDCVRGLVLAAEHYEESEPVNLGTGSEITIRGLVELIKEITGFDGVISWDSTKPDGQPRRCLDVSKANKRFGFRAEIPFVDGLKETLEWYKDNR